MAAKIGFAAMGLLAALSPFATFLVELGAISAGSIAVGTAVGYAVGAIAKDLGADVDPLDIAQRGAALGAVFGVAYGLLTLVR
jgi:hypothetical protein